MPHCYMGIRSECRGYLRFGGTIGALVAYHTYYLSPKSAVDWKRRSRLMGTGPVFGP